MASLLRLFFTSADANLEQRAPQLDIEMRRALHSPSFALVGPRSSGKTALMCAFCHSVAAEGDKALVLTVKENLFDGSAVLVGGDRSAPEWKQVEIKHVRDVNDAVLALSAIHLMADPPPRAICVDNVELLVGTSTAGLAKLLAALHDARSYCSNRIRKVLKREKICASLLSFSSTSFSLQWARIVPHWGTAVLSITSHRNKVCC